MQRDIFYNARNLPHEKQEKILRKAYSICERWWFDKLNCSESYARQKVGNVSFEEAMSHFVEEALMNVIHRADYLEPSHIEVSFRSMELPVDYFLWIVVPLDRADAITKDLEILS